MAHITADRVRDTSTTTGTGAFTVTGSAPTGYRTFSAVCSTNDTLFYAIQHQTATEWEVGLGTYSASNQITRTTVMSSSNSNSAVNFSAGAKDVYLTLPSGGVGLKRRTAITTTSGTYHDFNDIPPWVTRITVGFEGLSLSGSAHGLIQLGSGSVTTSGYVAGANFLYGGASSGSIDTTGGFVLYIGSNTNIISGAMTFSLLTGNTWIGTAVSIYDNAAATNGFAVGKIALSGVLDRVRFTTTNGTDTFDAGTINLLYEG